MQTNTNDENKPQKNSEPQIIIKGGTPLVGEVEISGAKNAALPLITACLLTHSELILKGVPNLADINTLNKLVTELGGVIKKIKKTNASFDLSLRTPKITNTTASYELVSTMRASVLVLGPLLSRAKMAKVSLPGGCAIGARPVDLHLKVMQALGAEIKIEGGYIIATAKNGLTGATYEFPTVSVGATENAVMAATLAKGTTILKNCAKEPEITDLIDCLIAMGAQIEGRGSNVLKIHGVENLKPAKHTVIADRIEAGSFACVAAGLKGSNLLLKNINPKILKKPLEVLSTAGANITTGHNWIRVGYKSLKVVDFITGIYPSFPTDLQAQFMALFSTASGKGSVCETIFENRFMHVPELIRLGANISLNANTARISGVKKLTAGQVMATDLRASMCLVIAALKAEGITKISKIYHLDRGYSALDEKLKIIGAHIQRTK